MRRILSLMAITAVAMMAEDTERYLTHSVGNGRLWKDVSRTSAGSALVAGFFYGCIMARSTEISCKDYFASKHTFAETRESLDQFYSDGANARIRIEDALCIARMKFEGAEATEIERFTVLARKIANEPAEAIETSGKKYQ
jgi:hypothetical protein